MSCPEERQPDKLEIFKQKYSTNALHCICTGFSCQHCSSLYRKKEIWSPYNANEFWKRGSEKNCRKEHQYSIESRQESGSIEKQRVECNSGQHHKCSFCDMQFNRSSDLQRHLLIHSKTKPYTCHVCERGFTWFGNFQKHMLTHGERQTNFHPMLNMDSMNEEELVVKDGKSFKCRLCLKLFTRMSGLRTHIRMHTGQRPYKCDQCSFAFTTSRALKMHIRIHTG